MPDPDRLDTAAVGARLGVTPATVRKYQHRTPPLTPDGHTGRRPWWHPATVDAWQASRPGQGVGGGRPARLIPTDPSGAST